MDALWFVETYGLMPQSLQLSDKDGSLHEVKVSPTAINSTEIQESPSSKGAGHDKNAESCKGEVTSLFTQNLLQNNSSKVYKKSYKMIEYAFWSYFSFNFITQTGKKRKAYDRLPLTEKEKIRAILFIMGRFSIS